jgi:hypothetical protein
VAFYSDPCFSSFNYFFVKIHEMQHYQFALFSFFQFLVETIVFNFNKGSEKFHCSITSMSWFCVPLGNVRVIFRASTNFTKRTFSQVLCVWLTMVFSLESYYSF